MKNPRMGKVTLVGAGPGDPELLTLRALRAIEQAEIIVHDRLVSPEILSLVPEHVRRIDVGKLPRHHRVPQEEINELLISLALQGFNVARLKGGDPMIFGRGSEEAEALHEAGISVSYVPGITAAQGASTSTGVPLTHRGLATSVRYVTGHRARNAALDLDWQSLANIETTLVVYMGVANIDEISTKLIEHGMPRDMPVLMVASATTPREECRVSTLSRIARDLASHSDDAPVLFIIGNVVSLYTSDNGIAEPFSLAQLMIPAHG